MGIVCSQKAPFRCFLTGLHHSSLVLPFHSSHKSCLRQVEAPKVNKRRSPTKHWHVPSFTKRKPQRPPRGTCLLQAREGKRCREITTCSTEAPFRRIMASVKSGLSVEKQEKEGKALDFCVFEYADTSSHCLSLPLPNSSSSRHSCQLWVLKSVCRDSSSHQDSHPHQSTASSLLQLHSKH